MTILTVENAKTAKTIRNIQNPEWGIKKFNYNEQPLNDGKAMSTWGTGANSSIICEGEYKFWEVIS